MAELPAIISKTGNALAQIGRLPGGIAQGLTKTVLAPGIMYESAKQNTVDYKKNTADAQKFIADLRTENPYLTQADLIDARAAGEITQAQYDNYINEWRENGSPLDQAEVHGILNRQSDTVNKPITKVAADTNAAIENWTNSWVPEAQSKPAEFIGKAADTVGEAIPTAAAAVLTDGMSVSSVLVGTPLSYAMGSANAYSTEMIEGSGDNRTAMLKAGTAFASEAIGGKLFESGSLVRGAIGEGLEENIDGGLQSLLTGESYTPQDAVTDFAYGATAGLALGGGANVVNNASAEITRGRVQGEVQARISESANADVADVQALISHASESPANAVVAQDSLAALQKQTANPVNTTQTTTAIPADIAEKFGLVPAGDYPGARPVSVEVRSYESIVEPQVAELAAPEVSISERADIDPNSATAINARSLYQYAPDVYIRPGTDVSESVFTYRGQGNQFYRTSLDAGTIPASGVGTSWEGSGVYSSPTPYTTDLYGPSGKLSDNPYNNRGIPQKAIDVDYPVGVILQQPASLAENVSPLTRQDAPNDAVALGERRIRYDDKGRGLVTEVINNPGDVSAAGLVFGRTGVSEATPIQYASSAAANSSSAGVSTVSEVNSEVLGVQSNQSIQEEHTGAYIIPDLVSDSVVRSAVHGAEHKGFEVKDMDSTEKDSGARSGEAPVEDSTGHQGTVLEEIPGSTTSITEASGANGVVPPDVPAAKSAADRAVPNMPDNAPGNGEATPEAYGPRAREAPAEIVSSSASGEELSAEDLASQIWTPAQSMARAAEDQNQRRKRDHKLPSQDFAVLKGPGATGEIFESTGYNVSFGSLSSY